MGRRIFFCIVSTIIFLHPLAGSDRIDRNDRNVIWFEQPASTGTSIMQNVKGGWPYDLDWEKHSLPIGNGYMGANIFGRTDVERIQLSEKTMNTKAEWSIGVFTNLSEIYLDFHHNAPREYRRELSLDKAVATVSYEYDGVRYSREYFANYPSNVIVVNIKADKPGRINFLLRPVLPYLREFNEDRTGRTGRVHAENDLITMKGELQYFNYPYEAQIKVLPSGGRLTATNDADGDHGMIQVCDADSVSLLIMAKTSYKLNENVFLLPPQEKVAGNPHPHVELCRQMETAVAKGVKELWNEHLDDYCSLFSRVSLNLGEDRPDIPTDKLRSEVIRGKNHTCLDELLFQYGRYLLISSSRKGALPANLQGVWTQYEISPWTGGYWHNINVQMNYWPAFNTDLAETFIPYVEYHEAYRKAANRIAVDYIRKINPSALDPVPEENGWIVGTGASVFTVESPGGHSGPGTGGFTAKMFWDYYEFTRDEDILRNHTYPAILGMSKYYSKMLKPSPDGFLLANPSASPEQVHNGKYYQTVGCTFDQSMIEDNYRDVLKAAAILKDKSPFLNTLRAQLPKLDAIHIGTSGQIKEFREEQAYGDIGEYQHRHISHLCALYPGSLINSNTPEWLEAAKVTLEHRGDKSYGWSMMHRMNLWARVKDGNRAYKIYKLFQDVGIADNLWCLHPPYQIDGNLGATAGVAEMLLQSHEGYIEPLPALPDSWAEGSFKGLVARGNFSVSASWSGGKLDTLDIYARAAKDEECTVRYEGISRAFLTDSQGRKVRFKTVDENLVRFVSKSGEKYHFTF